MKQIYSTGTLAASGPQAVRALTGGLGSDAVESALALAHYNRPQYAPLSVPGEAAAFQRLPARLALLNSPAGRVLTHVTPQESGSTFAHTIVGVPATADAQLAIQTWGSPLWQKQSPESTGELPELPYLPVADVLDDAALQNWLASPAHQDMLEFVLSALLGTPSTVRVVLAAGADDVAEVVYAVTRAFPQGLLDDFTFSTYEADPLACPARLIGHEAGELPEACYAGELAVGYNPGTTVRSTLATQVPFARFAVERLAHGETGPLEEVKATWQRFGLREARQFDLAYRLTRGTGVLTQAEAAEALQYPPLAAWVSTRADAMKQFTEWALDDRDFAVNSFTRAAQALRQKPDVTAKIGQAVREAGVKALQSDDPSRAANALEVVLPMVAPAKANAVWGELFNTLDPATLAWPTRRYLLPRFVRFQTSADVAGVAWTKWLSLPPEHLADLLTLDLPRAHQVAAARHAANRPGDLDPGLVRTLAQNPPLVFTLLKATELTGFRAGELFAALLEESPTFPWLEELLGRAADYPTPLLNSFFETALTAGKLDADRAVRIQGARFLELFAGQTGLARVGTQFLAVPPPDLLRNAALIHFLVQLQAEPELPPELTERLAAVLAVRHYLDAPDFTPEALAATASALKLAPAAVPDTAKADVFAAVADALAKRADDAGLQADLETCLVHFGPVLANDATDLYENLLRDLRTRLDFGKHLNLVPTFLAVALGATQHPQLEGKLEGLDGAAFAVAADAAKRGGSRLLAEVDRVAQAWPRAAKTQWGFLSAAVRPRGAHGVLRDAALVVGGALAASAAWGVWALVG